MADVGKWLKKNNGVYCGHCAGRDIYWAPLHMWVKELFGKTDLYMRWCYTCGEVVNLRNGFNGKLLKTKMRRF